VPTHLIGNDAFQEADTVGITRPCTKHNYLVKDVDQLARIVHEAFYVASAGRPGPVVIDVPKDIAMAKGRYVPPPRPTSRAQHKTYRPRTQPNTDAILQAIALMAAAKRPLFYTGGGVINSGPRASAALRALVRATGFPITSTLMGLGAYPAADPQWLGMVGMHGLYEANLAMHGCDLMINIGARFDDRVTGNLTLFSPGSLKIHVDIDPSSINKNVVVNVPIVGDCAEALEAMLAAWSGPGRRADKPALKAWWKQIDAWRGRDCLQYEQNTKVIKPQYAIERLYELTKHRDAVITTEVGQHQMWAAQFYRFEQPGRWITSGGLGTMGFGLPAAIGAQLAKPDALVIDIAGEASVLMNIQELSTAVQHKAAVKVFIINNRYMGMVRQWQEMLHGGRYSHSYSEALPDFVKLAEAFGCTGLRVGDPAKLDDTIRKMIATDGPVVCEVLVDQAENCFPMIPSGRAHNDMILTAAEGRSRIAAEGRALV
ncbi:MAG: biosynthetic-type acetolactate synthase large subunit, partial [Rhodospirillaceae bacterium]